nr:BNR repeat-containing protein [Pedobacter sp. ASV19]
MMTRMMLCLWISLCFGNSASAQGHIKLQQVSVDGWANNSVNVVVFRKNSLVTYKGEQYCAFYDRDQYVVLAKRTLNSSKWTLLRSSYQGDAADAHKSISIMVDGAGFLHVAWGQHNNPLSYARSLTAGSLILGPKKEMLGRKETKVSYPEFHKLHNGNLIFLYRDGGSGNGDLVINQYNIKTQSWERVQDNLIDGEGKRNAYWQMIIDAKGTMHLSWVWRESPDVASNHDMCYARSEDGGQSWMKSTGEPYQLPIREENAEYACRIPQNSELINQTSMATDDSGQPYIASYWREKGTGIPQYHIISKQDGCWKVQDLAFRHLAFTLSGSGTKRIPISRPQLITWNRKKKTQAGLIFRDEERGDKISMAYTNDLAQQKWIVKDLTSGSVGDWEPTFDTELWKQKKRLDLFVQKVVQVDGEGKADHLPTEIQVLEWEPY